MSNSPFEVGDRYRNEHGEYEVLGIDENQMVVRYDNGIVQDLGLTLQSRIWQRIQDGVSPPPVTRKPISQADSLDTQPVCDLVQAVLDSKFKAPYPEDITDRVCLEIENDPDWLSQYHSLVEHFGSQGKNGRLTVNSSIGWFTKDLTGMVNIGEGKKADSGLIKSYSKLGYR